MRQLLSIALLCVGSTLAATGPVFTEGTCDAVPYALSDQPWLNGQFDGTEYLAPGACDGCGVGCCDAGPDCSGGGCGSWLENLSLFAGLEGSKQPQDFGVNANFGGRFHANLGLPLVETCGLGLQLGSSINYTDNAVQVFERIEGTKDRFQNFTTFGLFQRLDNGWSWALGYDYLFQDFYDDFDLGQWRGDVGYQLNACNEIGGWFAISDRRNGGLFGTTPVVLDPISQGSIYWRRTWENDAQTSFWIGIAEGHGEVNVALGDLEPVGERVVFGSELFVPLRPQDGVVGAGELLDSVRHRNGGCVLRHGVLSWRIPPRAQPPFCSTDDGGQQYDIRYRPVALVPEPGFDVAYQHCLLKSPDTRWPVFANGEEPTSATIKGGCVTRFW